MDEQRRRAFAFSRHDQLTALIVGILCALLYFTTLHSYLLFHALAEILFIVVCLCVLVVAWSLREFLDDDFALFLGIALAAVAVLHSVHVVDYPGLDLIGASQDPPTQIWLGARFLLAVALIASTFVIGRRLRLWVAAACCVAYDALLLASIYWWRIFPATLVPAEGLTEFKKVSEYVICLLFALAVILFLRQGIACRTRRWRLLGAALGRSIGAELWFTLYRSAHTWPNLLGHLFLVLSAILLFRAVVDDGLARPHAVAMRNLSEAEKMHRRLEQALVPSLPVEHEGLEVVTSYQAGERHLELSGDFIDVARPRRLGGGRHLRRRERPRSGRRRHGRDASRELASAHRQWRRAGDDRDRTCAPCSSANARTPSRSRPCASPGSIPTAARSPS